jgi:hypothetical protein
MYWFEKCWIKNDLNGYNKVSTTTHIMHAGEISFCCHIGLNVKSDEVKKDILTELNDKYNYKIINKHFEKYNDDKIDILKTRPHMVSLRTNGNPYFLYLTQINGVNQCIFIDKKVQNGYIYPRMVIVKFFFNHSLFEYRTLFDGEMVKTDGDDWLFIMNDIFVDRGVSCCVNLMKRISRIYEVLCYNLIVTSQDVCAFQVKKYFEYDIAENMLTTFQSSLPYSCRGLYFTPLFLKHRPILMNFDDTLIKKKIQEKKDSTSFVISVQDPHKTITNHFSKPSNIMSSGSSQAAPTTRDALRLALRVCNPVDSRNNEPVESTQPEGHTRRMFLRKTHVVDIYDVFDDKGKYMDVAFVNSMKSSKALREAFLNTTPVDKIPFECEYNEKFKKWRPLLS